MTQDTPTFSDSAEEILYWRTKAEEYKLAAETSKEELDEFQEGSRELEAELEAQLEQVEIKNKELKSLTNRLTMENDHIKDKLEQCNREYHFQINELESELSDIKGIKDKLAKYVRELEQSNDDLERAKRSTLASLEDFEMRMNTAIERNAFLESELDEKEQLKTVVQRLKDETRDLRGELRVLNPQIEEDEEPDNDRVMERSMSASVAGGTDGATTNSDKVKSDKMNGDTPLKNGGGVVGNLPNSPPLTPSARISALGIVGDLLRKVGALELKLVSCRNIVKENGKDGGREFSNINSIDRKGRIPRGASSPAVKNLCENGSSCPQDINTDYQADEETGDSASSCCCCHFCPRHNKTFLQPPIADDQFNNIDTDESATDKDNTHADISFKYHQEPFKSHHDEQFHTADAKSYGDKKVTNHQQKAAVSNLADGSKVKNKQQEIIRTEPTFGRTIQQLNGSKETSNSLLELAFSLKEPDISLQETEKNLESSFNLKEPAISLKEQDNSLRRPDISFREKDISLRESANIIRETEINLQNSTSSIISLQTTQLTSSIIDL